MYVCNKDFLDDCQSIARSARGELEISCAIQHAIDRGEKFIRYIMSEPQIDIGTPERYRALCAKLKKASNYSDATTVARQKAAPGRQAE
jgi:dTDP-glucose pyrophosphorylase